MSRMRLPNISSLGLPAAPSTERRIALYSGQVYASGVHLKKSVSIVAARRELGRLAEEVGRTGQPVALTRRGRVVARIAPEPGAEPRPPQPRDAFAELRGTVRLNCTLDELQTAVKQLRTEFTRSLGHRAALLAKHKARARA
jgi:antitoxin (DNA-binding transcriptional repressor) of toxin-antitoxin stability system